MVRQAPAWLSMAMVRRSVLTDTPYFFRQLLIGRQILHFPEFPR